MDALEDKDLVLQRASADLLSELHFSIPRLLFKTSGASTKRELRSEISYVATAHLIRLVHSPIPDLLALTKNWVTARTISRMAAASRRTSECSSDTAW